MGSKIGCLTEFFHHSVSVMSLHTHAYQYHLIKSRTITGLSTTALCRKIIKL